MSARNSQMGSDMGLDIVFVGAGLANCLIAARLKERRPHVRFLLLEADEAIGGNHTWSFHDQDLSADQNMFLKPFVAHSWPGYDVYFPARARALSGRYASLTADSLAAGMAERAYAFLRTGAKVREVAADHVVLEGGEVVAARAVVDGRGAVESGALDLGYQKFVGQEVRLSRPHGLTRPIIMDARVPQIDGYRFVYVLPFAEDTLLVEDTYYADGPDLPVADVRARIAAYCQAQGWAVDYVAREEGGILPIALGGDIRALFAEGPPGVARAGLRAALFHPTTGYSLPDAVRLADKVSRLADLSGPALSAAIEAHAVETWEARGFFRLLNRMLFRAAAPDRRYAVLERFYGLNDGLIARFYADRLTFADKARILMGKPPVPIGRAMSCLSEKPRSGTAS